MPKHPFPAAAEGLPKKTNIPDLIDDLNGAIAQAELIYMAANSLFAEMPVEAGALMRGLGDLQSDLEKIRAKCLQARDGGVIK